MMISTNKVDTKKHHTKLKKYKQEMTIKLGIIRGTQDIHIISNCLKKK